MTLIKDVMLSRDWGRQKVCWPLQSSFAPKENLILTLQTKLCLS